MNILMIVNSSPWGSTRALAAWRFARAWLAAGHRIEAIFFRGDGVYNALPGTVADSGTPDLANAWAELGAPSNPPLWLCSAALARRLPSGPETLATGFRPAGLLEAMAVVPRCDRVVNF